MATIFKPKAIKGFIASSKLQFSIGFICVVIGIIIGIVIHISGDYTAIFSSSTVSLNALIIGEYSSIGLFFSSFFKLLLPILIIFIFSLNKFSSILNFVYLAYQGLLLGGSLASVVIDYGITGTLNAIIFIAPVNLINLTILTYASALFIKRREYSKKFRKSILQGVAYYLSEHIGLLLGVIVSCVIYGVIYPILLRSMIIVNY